MSLNALKSLISRSDRCFRFNANFFKAPVLEPEAHIPCHARGVPGTFVLAMLHVRGHVRLSVKSPLKQISAKQPFARSAADSTREPILPDAAVTVNALYIAKIASSD